MCASRGEYGGHCLCMTRGSSSSSDKTSVSVYPLQLRLFLSTLPKHEENQKSRFSEPPADTQPPHTIHIPTSATINSPENRHTKASKSLLSLSLPIHDVPPAPSTRPPPFLFGPHLADEAEVASPRPHALLVEHGDDAHPALHQTQHLGVVREVYVAPRDSLLLILCLYAYKF